MNIVPTINERRIIVWSLASKSRPNSTQSSEYIRDELGLSDSALSKQLSTLESAGYVEIRKRFVGKRPRTSASLSRPGRQAFEQHVAALQQIIARSQQDADAAPAAEADHGIPGR